MIMKKNNYKSGGTKMKKIKHLLTSTLILFVFGILSVSAVNFPVVDDMPIVGGDTGNWGDKLLRMHNKTVETIQQSLTVNGTLRNDLNVTFNKIYGEFPDSFKLLNFTNAYDSRNDRYSIINFTSNYDTRNDRFKNINFSSLYNNIGDRFSNLNFTNLYYSVTDRFTNLNWTTLYNSRLDRFSNLNFTNLYDSRTDRFSVENGTTLSFSNFRLENESNPTNATIEFARIGGYTSAWTFSNLTSNANLSNNINHVVCWKTAIQTGYCSSAVDATGSCICN